MIYVVFIGLKKVTLICKDTKNGFFKNKYALKNPRFADLDYFAMASSYRSSTRFQLIVVKNASMYFFFCIGNSNNKHVPTGR